MLLSPMGDQRVQARVDDPETPATSANHSGVGPASETRPWSSPLGEEYDGIDDRESGCPPRSRTGDDDNDDNEEARYHHGQGVHEEEVPPQWLDNRDSADRNGVGLGLAIWPPTPALPSSPTATSLLPPSSPSLASSHLSSCPSSRSTSPVIGEDYAISPIDLVNPSAGHMPSVSVADGPMGRLAAGTVRLGTRVGSRHDLTFRSAHSRTAKRDHSSRTF